MITNAEFNILQALNDVKICSSYDRLINFDFCGKTYAVASSEYSGEYDDKSLEEYQKHISTLNKHDCKVYILLYLRPYWYAERDDTIAISKIFYRSDLIVQFKWVKDTILTYDSNIVKKGD